MIIETLRARRAFAQIAALDESLFFLDRAALAIGLEEYPDLEVEHYLHRLDGLASSTEVLLGQDRSPMSVIRSLNEVLFLQAGFRGNAEDYYDPKNSYLNEVLDSKSGIPISLSVIYIEVARRIGFPIQGVGFPGHFLVRVSEKGQEILIDPFGGGRILSMRDCQELLDRVYGGSVTVQPSLLQPMEKRGIISRMLFNLKGIYYQKEEYQKALSIVEKILMLNPGMPSEIRDRGLLFMQTSLFAKALADLEYYLHHTAAPEDAAYIQGHVKTLRSIVGGTN
ncbi:MAG TPA: transglutaminase-like domain-containing protein [Acidobacteriota bacterium]|nr:transglutaminase-like domain-containing protein [Acidobacteriota bacterium]